MTGIQDPIFFHLFPWGGWVGGVRWLSPNFLGSFLSFFCYGAAGGTLNSRSWIWKKLLILFSSLTFRAAANLQMQREYQVYQLPCRFINYASAFAIPQIISNRISVLKCCNVSNAFKVKVGSNPSIRPPTYTFQTDSENTFLTPSL